MKRNLRNAAMAVATFTGVLISRNVVLAEDNNLAPTNQVMESLTSQQFVSDAAVGGMKEIYLSQLALDKSTNADVKNLANHMIKDHTAANAKLAKLARAGGYNFPATNTFSADDPNWNNPLLTHPEDIKGGQMLIMTNLPYMADYRAVGQLKSIPNDQFDQAYLDDMVQDHTQAVNEFDTASQTLADQKLKKFAQKTLPTLRKHSEMAQELNNKFNQMASNPGTNPVTRPSMNPM